MALYDKPVRLLMREMVSDLGVQKGQVFSRDQVLAWFARRYPKIKRGTITAHLIRLSTNARSRIHYSAKPGDDDLFFQIDGGHFRLYESASDPAPIYDRITPEGAEAESIAETPEGAEPASGFAYESDLRDFLAKNLSLLEPGLRLYQDEEIKGIEFPAGGRLIDLLAVDAQGNLVVIEFKVSRGYDRVVGQLLRYMAWIEKNLAEPGQVVRGAIVARELSEDLILACTRVAGVELYDYQLSVTLRRLSR